MVTVGAYEAKTRLAELLRMVEAGERVLITRHGRPVALLTSSSCVPQQAAVEAVEELEGFGVGRSLGPSLTIQDLIDEGRT